eukprot:2160965-Pleurochrysis_carterae.AAC.1
MASVPCRNRLRLCAVLLLLFGLQFTLAPKGMISSAAYALGQSSGVYPTPRSASTAQNYQPACA